MQLRRHNLTKDNIPDLVKALRGAPGEDDQLRELVDGIIGRVRREGDEALVSLTREFDCPGFSLDQLRVPLEEIEAATLSAPAELMEALKMAAENVRLFHQHEMRGSWTAAMRHSQMLGQRMIPVDRAGLYVPGGGAAYPSTVLMTVIPAQVAGVSEIFICTPPGADGKVNQAVLAAAGLLGVSEIYRVGGAQAVAAMAFGTPTIRSSNVIVGPGN
ncbi:MAG: histidinol dehydrogenase, partial [Actinomycetota bacterium]